MGKMKWKMIQAKDFCLWLFSYDEQGTHREVWTRGSNSEIVALHVYITDITTADFDYFIRFPGQLLTMRYYDYALSQHMGAML